MEVRSIEEDAGILDESRSRFTVLIGLDDPVLALGLELPLVVGETFRGLDHALDVFFVDEVCSVAAAALGEFGGVPVEDTLTAVVENTRPVTFKKCDVENKRAIFVVGLETDPLVGFERSVTHEKQVSRGVACEW